MHEQKKINVSTFNRLQCIMYNGKTKRIVEAVIFYPRFTHTIFV